MLSKDALLALHTFAFTIGVGGSTLVYGYFLLKLRDQVIDDAHIRFIERVSMMVGSALVLLWISGAGLVYHKYLADPAVLTNPKVQVKVLIVSILTANGFFIHLRIFPIIRRSVGHNLFSFIQPRQRTLLLTGGGISCVSWYLPFALGYIKQIDQVVPFGTLLGLYLCLLVGAIGMAHFLGTVLITRNADLDGLRADQERLRLRSAGAGTFTGARNR